MAKYLEEVDFFTYLGSEADILEHQTKMLKLELEKQELHLI